VTTRAGVTNNKMIRFPLLTHTHTHTQTHTHTLPPPRRWFHSSAGMQLWISWRIHLRQTFTVEQITASWGAAEILTHTHTHTHIHTHAHAQSGQWCTHQMLPWSDVTNKPQGYINLFGREHKVKIVKWLTVHRTLTFPTWICVLRFPVQWEVITNYGC